MTSSPAVFAPCVCLCLLQCMSVQVCTRMGIDVFLASCWFNVNVCEFPLCFYCLTSAFRHVVKSNKLLGVLHFAPFLFFLRDSEGNEPAMMQQMCHTPRPGDEGGRVRLSANRRRSPNRFISRSSSESFMHY